jgi:RNA-binding motif protein, X-linked 2
MNRIIRVDHTRYKKRDGEVEDDQDHKDSGTAAGAIEDDERRRVEPGEDGDAESERPMLREERELAILIRDHDDDDPMKAFLIREKKEKISAALAKLKDGKAPKSDKRSKDHHHHHHHHRSHQSGGLDELDDRKRHSRRRRDEDGRRRSRSRD